MSAYEIFSSKQPHENSNLDAKLRKYLQRFIPAQLKDKPKEYIQKGKSIHSIRRIMRRYPNKEKIKQRLKDELMRGHRKRGRPPYRQRRWTSVRRDEYLQEARDELREELKNKSDNHATQSTSNSSPPPQRKKKKQTKIVTPPPSPNTPTPRSAERNRAAVSLEEIEKASESEEEEEEEEDTDRAIIDRMKELAKKRKFGKRAKNDEQLRQDDEIDAAREYLRGAPSHRRERKELNDYLLTEMGEDQIREMEEDEVDPEEYLMRNMFIADDYD